MKVSFVIVEYHSINELIECCSCIKERFYGKLEFEIIISSNSIYPQRKRMEIQEQFNYLIWVFNERNGGFAYAMDHGLAKAIGDVFIIMNPDVKIEVGILDMLSYFLSDPNIGIIAPKIINEQGLLQDSFRDFITPLNFIKRHFTRVFNYEKLVVTAAHPQKVDWVIGAFMMTRRSVYEKVGGLDEKYFMYCEDMDWCKRMYQVGLDVIYYPGAVIEYEGTCSARRSWKYTVIFIKSLFRYWSKFGI